MATACISVEKGFSQLCVCMGGELQPRQTIDRPGPLQVALPPPSPFTLCVCVLKPSKIRSFLFSVSVINKSLLHSHL